MKKNIAIFGLLPLALLIHSCNKNTGYTPNNLIETNTGVNAGINAQLSISSKEDSTILDDEKKYKRMVKVYDKTKQYWVNASISTDEVTTFENVIKNIENALTIDILYSKPNTPASNNTGSETEQSTTIDIKAKYNMTCVVVSTHLPDNALGFGMNHNTRGMQLISYGPPEIADNSISGGEGYTYGWEYATLANGLMTFNVYTSILDQNMKVIREYKKRWYNSWSNWGHAVISRGYSDNYCIKDQNRIRVRVYYNAGTTQSCGTYGSSTCY